jgi:trk system potassium uptake protein
MSVLRVFPVLGMIVMVFALTMLVPLGVSWAIGDGAHAAYPLAIGVTLLTGLAMRAAVWRVGRKLELQTRDGILLVGLAWTLLPLFACLPLLLYFSQAGAPMSFTAAYF